MKTARPRSMNSTAVLIFASIGKGKFRIFTIQGKAKEIEATTTAFVTNLKNLYDITSTPTNTKKISKVSGVNETSMRITFNGPLLSPPSSHLSLRLSHFIGTLIKILDDENLKHYGFSSITMLPFLKTLIVPPDSLTQTATAEVYFVIAAHARCLLPSPGRLIFLVLTFI